MVSAKWVTGDIRETEKINEILKKNLPQKLREYAIKLEKNAEYVIVFDGDNIAAAGVLGLSFTDVDSLMLGPVAVNYEYRNRGYGGLLMRMMIRKAFDAGFIKHFIICPPGIRDFSYKLGFGKVSELSHSLIRMEREGDISGNC